MISVSSFFLGIFGITNSSSFLLWIFDRIIFPFSFKGFSFNFSGWMLPSRIWLTPVVRDKFLSKSCKVVFATFFFDLWTLRLEIFGLQNSLRKTCFFSFLNSFLNTQIFSSLSQRRKVFKSDRTFWLFYYLQWILTYYYLEEMNKCWQKYLLPNVGEMYLA